MRATHLYCTKLSLAPQIQVLSPRNCCWTNSAILGGHKLQHKLGKQIGFDRLPRHIQDQKIECDIHRQMAEGTKFPFYGVVQILFGLDVKLDKVFVVSLINKDAILGIPFLARHDCKIDFPQLAVTIGKRELVCNDRFGRLMASRVQTIRSTTISQ